ncbi:MAG: histidine phosphatase family protein [Anaerolineae bacterium]
MELYFVRHGQAEDSQPPDFDDFARSLTEKGAERIHSVGKVLAKMGLKPAVLYSSPRLRARQTGEILAGILNVNLTLCDDLNFGFNPLVLPNLIQDFSKDQQIVFVGHEPDLSITVSSLIGGGELEMKKGGVLRVDLVARTPLRGVLFWALTPRVLDAMDDK